MLDWDDLRYFLTVARSGSLSAAARDLEVAQPTVGRRIRAFERSLGAKLFVATLGGQSLSATGQRMLRHAEHMEQEALSAERVAAGRDAGLSGSVSVSASEWMVRSVLGPLMAPFIASHPQLTLELVAEARHTNLARREADIALRPSRFSQPKIVQRRVASLGFGLYASDSYLARSGTPNFDEHGTGHTLICMSESLGKVPDVDWLPLFASRARIAVRANGREPMATLAAAGIGIACLPRFLGDAMPGLRRLPTPIPEPTRALWLGVHRDARGVARVKATATFLTAAIERLHRALCPNISP